MENLVGKIDTYTLGANGIPLSYVIRKNDLERTDGNFSDFLSQTRSESSHGSIYNSDGSIITGHIPNWRNLTHEERNLVKEERRKSKTNRDTRNNDDMKANANRIKQLQASNKKMKRKIKAMKRSSKKGGEDNEDGESDDLDAGDTFGGKASKRKKTDS